MDGTHIKASANLNKKIKQEVPAAAKRYQEELLAEINADREAHEKKPPVSGLEKKPAPVANGGKKLSGPTAGGSGKKSPAPKPKKSGPAR